MVRGGAGIYYDFQTSVGIADEERVSLGPRGVGRGSYFSGGIGNPLTDVPGVSQGSLLDFQNPTLFTGATALQILAHHSRGFGAGSGRSEQSRLFRH